MLFVTACPTCGRAGEAISEILRLQERNFEIEWNMFDTFCRATFPMRFRFVSTREFVEVGVRAAQKNCCKGKVEGK